MATLLHRQAGRVPRFEIWIDALFDELGQSDPTAAYASLGQDAVMMPAVNPLQSCAWQTGTDEWGRVWHDAMYVDGAVDSREALQRYRPLLSYVEELCDRQRVEQVRRAYPDHYCLMLGTHIGRLTAAFMASGPQRFFTLLTDDPALARRILDKRTEWCIAVYERAVGLGADVVVLGDDAGSGRGLLISPPMWRKFVLPGHRRIVDALHAPVIWHSDGNVAALLPIAIEAGFVGFHGLDPPAGMDLAGIKKQYGDDLVLIGNADVRVLFGADLSGACGGRSLHGAGSTRRRVHDGHLQQHLRGHEPIGSR